MQAFPLEVDARRDVFDEPVSRVRFLEVFALAFKVGSLLCATDPCIDVALLGGFVLSKESKHTIEAIQALTSGCTNMVESSGGRPVAKCARREVILRLEVGGALIYYGG